MKLRIVLALIFATLVLVGASLIPNGSGIGIAPYPTPQPPASAYPIYFGVYCHYLSPANPGLISVKWDDPPVWFSPNTVNPGSIRVWYGTHYNDYPLQLNENGITKIWGTIWWYPHENESAKITGYVSNALPPYQQITIQPTYYYQYCPEPFTYLPLIMR